ncbi:ABC transporter substrate-binding protein [Actinacidiphila sp. DG2A-62]|uniref:ABC transporter substrate-binding protein n=1 Tax=Actinacidiphila sp. DG2A-62 TaxID=3108821 RepID=UPI002DBCCD8D|nr:ABC transporter substrate-binding protein [Actinacidiphila sp. DG2A-62]MEC3993760.1 ABC transporter substrate-binding protein [Actinacidiphila sp. DG2A-62]
MSRTTALRRAAAIGALAPLLLLSACGGTAKGGAASSGKDLVLGASLSLTGALGQFGVDLQAGYRQRVSQINAAGGLDVGGTRRHVKLTVLDNRSDPNTATQQVRELVLKDGASALLGACTPPITVPQALAADRQKVPYVTSCTPVRAFQAGNKAGWRYAWDLFFDEGDQARAVAEGLAEVGANKKVALFTDTEPDGVAERPLYKQQAAAKGLTVVGDYTFPVGTTDFASFIDDAKRKGAQLVVAQMVPPDGIALWKQMKALDYKPTAAFAAKAASGKSWPQALGPLAEGTLSDEFWSPATGAADSAALANTLGKAFPGNLPDENIAVLGYTVAGVVADAFRKAASTDADQVNAALRQTDADYPLGRISFGRGHTSVTPYLLTQWQHGDVAVVAPAAPGVVLQAPAQGLR